MIRVGNTLARLGVTENLQAALLRLQRSSGDRVLWVDAVCINQQDVKERNEQVRKMDVIYGLAKEVCIWLGDQSMLGGSARAMVAKILDLSTFEKNAKEATHDHVYYMGWATFVEYMSLPWFTRRWIIQEIVLARKATLYCGDFTVDWDCFADAVSLFATNETLSRFWDPRTIPATALVSASKNLCRRFGPGRIRVENLKTMDVLVSTLTSFHATDPRDTVFAVLALAKGRGSTGIFLNMVDYNHTVLDVFTNFIAYLIDTFAALDMICIPWAPNIEGLPSWVCQVSQSAFSTEHFATNYNRPGRQNADSLVGPLGRKNYSASGDRKADAKLVVKLVQEKGSIQTCLSAKGFHLLNITEIGAVCKRGMIPKSWLRDFVPDYGPDNFHNKPFWEDFWKTLVAGRGLDGLPPPNWFSRACRFIIDYDESDYIDTGNMIFNGPSSVVAKYLERIQKVVWNRRFGNTHVNYSCMLPAEAEVGDKICIIFRCSVPVVLRSYPSGMYRLIGQCYVEGLMDGEGLEKDDKVEVFEIF